MGLKVGKLNNNNSDVPRYLFFPHLGISPRGLIWGIAKKKERSPENIIITPIGFGNLIHIPSSSFSLFCLPSSDELPNLWWNTKLPKQPLISSPLIIIIIISTLSYLMRAFLSPLSPSCVFFPAEIRIYLSSVVGRILSSSEFTSMQTFTEMRFNYLALSIVSPLLSPGD